MRDEGVEKEGTADWFRRIVQGSEENAGDERLQLKIQQRGTSGMLFTQPGQGILLNLTEKMRSMRGLVTRIAMLVKVSPLKLRTYPPLVC